MTLSDLQWVNKIFNDTKDRAVCLRQLNFWGKDGKAKRYSRCELLLSVACIYNDVRNFLYNFALTIIVIC